MYSRFIQFTIPAIGQALMAMVLYVNFLFLPFVAVFQAENPLLYYLLPLVLMAAAAYFSRNPVGTGMVWVGFLTVFTCWATFAGGLPGCWAAPRGPSGSGSGAAACWRGPARPPRWCSAGGAPTGSA